MLALLLPLPSALVVLAVAILRESLFCSCCSRHRKRLFDGGGRYEVGVSLATTRESAAGDGCHVSLL